MNKTKLFFSILVGTTILCVTIFKSEHRPDFIANGYGTQKKSISKSKDKIAKHELTTTHSLSVLKILTSDPKQVSLLTKEEFQKIAEKITSLELFEIKIIALSLNESNQKRQASLFILSNIGYVAADSLAEIIETKIPHLKKAHSPHSIDNTLYANEISLRITALEALDNLSIDHPTIKNKIESIITNQKNPEINYLAQIALSGILNNRPGKIKRVIDAMLTERNNS